MPVPTPLQMLASGIESLNTKIQALRSVVHTNSAARVAEFASIATAATMLTAQAKAAVTAEARVASPVPSAPQTQS